MKTAYSVVCDFAGDGPESLAKAWALTWEWLSPNGFALPPESQAEGRSEGDSGHEVTWRVVRSGDDEVRRLEHKIEPSETANTGWRTFVWICREGDRAWGLVRSGPDNASGVVTDLRYDTRRPKLVSEWLDHLTVVRDGRRIEQKALAVGQGDVPALVDLLMDPRRRLPVVGISKVRQGGAVRTLADVDSIVYKLAGNAHVAVLDRAASWALTGDIGQPLSVFDGAVRVWWPGTTSSDDAYRHMLVMPYRLLDDPRRAEQLVVRRIWGAAIDSTGVPAVEAVILRRRDRERTEQRVAQLTHEVAEAGEWAELLNEQMNANELLQDTVAELQAENEDLFEALRRVEIGSDEDDDDLNEVDTVEEAVRKAADEATRVVYLNGAYDSARESRYPDPNQVLKDLRALERVAQRWVAGDLTSGFVGGFAEEPVTFKPGIGQIAQTKFRADYEIEYGGDKVLMGPHLRRGIGAPSAILRIYWYTDDSAKRFVVGHVGAKLRDVSHS